MSGSWISRAWLVLGLVAGCSDDSYLIVTVDARPAVHDTAKLAITLTNAGSMRTDTLSVGSHGFPLTFSLSAPGRVGGLDIAIVAEDASGIAVGQGSAATSLDQKTADVMLDTTDFVVNSEVAMDQFLAFGDNEAAGLQLGASSDGTWMVGFRDNCNGGSSCNIYGRKFDANGKAVSTTIGGDDQQFILSTMPTTAGSYPAVASNGMTTVVLWDYGSGGGTGHVACRALDAMGTPTSGENTVSTDTADVVTVTPLSNGNFAASWQILSGMTMKIRSVIVKPDCTQLAPGMDVSQVVGVLGPYHSHVAANGANVMYAWILDGDVHIRPGTNTGPTGNDTTLLTHSMQYEARIARVAPMGNGFAIVVRWGYPLAATGMGPGKIELFQVTPGGMITGTPLTITDQSLSDFTSGSQSFGVATRSDGAMLIAWHVCDAAGTPGTCDVFGRMVRPSGTTSGPVFEIPTTTTGDQTGPSVIALQKSPPDAFVIAWTDESHTAPDTQGQAVRARVLYPPYDPNGTM
jgi:hypothetical protein